MKGRFQVNFDFLFASFASIVMFGVLIIACIVFSRILSWDAIANQVPDAKDRITIHNELLKTLVQLLGGSLLLGGFYFTWRTIRISQEGQITDRFNKAIDHLGSDSLEIRLGGIYALVRIAMDSYRDAQPVMDILCGYIRSRTGGKEFLFPPADIQAILNWIAFNDRKRLTIDLSGAVLTGANLRRGKLWGAILENSNLEKADLSGSCLDYAKLSTANLNDANVRFASLHKASLRGTNLGDAHLRNTDLRDTDILGANLDGCNLSGADLTGAQNAVRQQFENAILDDQTKLPAFEVPDFT